MSVETLQTVQTLSLVYLGPLPKILLVTFPTFESLRKQTFSLLFYGITMANHPPSRLHLLLLRRPSVCFPWCSSVFLPGDPISILLLITSSRCVQTVFVLRRTGLVTRRRLDHRRAFLHISLQTGDFMQAAKSYLEKVDVATLSFRATRLWDHKYNLLHLVPLSQNTGKIW